MSVESLLEERGKRYGSYSFNTRRFWDLATRVDLFNLSKEHPEEAYALMMVLVKVSRLAHKLDDKESWVDICGYATLAIGEHNDY